MKTVLAILLLLGAGFLAEEFVRYKRRLPIGFKAVLYTFSEFLLVGLFLGPSFLNVLTEEILAEMRPFIAIGVGWVGILFGLQFDWARVRRFAPRLYGLSFLQAFIAAGVVFAGFTLVSWILGAQWAGILVWVLPLAAIASITAPTAISVVFMEDRIRGENAEILRFVASVDGIIGLFLFCIAVAFQNPYSLSGYIILDALLWVFLSILFGVLLGALFCILLQRRGSREEILIYTAGILIIAGSISYSLKISPLFVAFIIGIILANFSHRSEVIYKALSPVEKPAFIVFLILVGALWKIQWGIGLALIPLFLGLRATGKALGIVVSRELFPKAERPSSWLALGLLSQGGLALTMVANLTILHPVSVFSLIQTLVIFSIILNEFITPTLTRLALQKAS